MNAIFKIKYKKSSLRVHNRPVLYTPGMCFSDIYVLVAFIYEICVLFVHVKKNVSASGLCMRSEAYKGPHL